MSRTHVAGSSSTRMRLTRTGRTGSPWRRVKRAMDLGVSVAGLILLAPLLLGVALAIRLTMGSPVLFRQVRPGYRDKPFGLVKFRTMRELPRTSAMPTPGPALHDSDVQRLSPLGRLLRRTSIDELPQLWNIARGDMSLVGPRPLLTEYLLRYTPEEARRHDVPPGLTGWAQVNGRGGIPMRERFALDVWYVDHWSIGLDMRILAMTLRRFVARDRAPLACAVDPWFDAFSTPDVTLGSTGVATESQLLKRPG
jgi:sugar transferase EpsL